MVRALLLVCLLASPAAAQDRPEGGALLDPEAFQRFVDSTRPFVDRFLDETNRARQAPPPDSPQRAMDALRDAVEGIGGQLEDAIQPPPLHLRIVAEPKNWA
jgi:hypothetical protein